MSLNVSSSVQEVLEEGLTRASRRRHLYCGPEQVLEVLLERRGDREAARAVGRCLKALPSVPFDPPRVEYARDFRIRTMSLAEERATVSGAREIGEEDLLDALLSDQGPLAPDLRQDLRRILRVPHQQGPRSRGGEAPARRSRTRALLQPFTTGEEDCHLVPREDLEERILQAIPLGGALVVGPPGSGRRTLLRLAARRLAAGTCPELLRGYSLVSLDPDALVAGTSYRGELEERVQAVVRELQEGGGKKVLVLEEVHRFAGSRSTGSADVLAMLLPGLRQGRFRLLGCTTHDQLRERLEKEQAALIEMLILVPMPVVRGEEGCRLLSGLGQELAARHAVEVDAAVTKRAVALAEEQLPHCAMPGSARQLITGAAVTLWFETEMLRSDGERRSSRYWRHVGVPADSAVRPRLDERHLLYELAQNHGIPIEHLDSSVRRKIEGLRDSFARQIFGQDHVLEVLDRAVKVALMNLADPRRPRGRLFFLGPPGTGKTECARILAQFLMGSEAALLRFDMSEFQDRSSVSSLLGSSRGLVDSEKGGRLTEPLRENPHRVILLDEIEKAHPDIFHLFLGILDNGECHDQQGGRVSFRHSILIFTSNAGSAGNGDLVHCDRAELVHRLRGTFSEAFLSRLESIVPFGPLTAEARRRVAAYQLGRVREQLLEVHGCELTWDDALTAIVETPAAGEKGARDILHWIHTQVKPALVDALLDTGGRRVHLRVTEDGAGVSAERMDEPNGCSGEHPGGKTEAATARTSTGMDEASSREVGAGAPRT